MRREFLHGQPRPRPWPKTFFCDRNADARSVCDSCCNKFSFCRLCDCSLGGDTGYVFKSSPAQWSWAGEDVEFIWKCRRGIWSKTENVFVKSWQLALSSIFNLSAEVEQSNTATSSTWRRLRTTMPISKKTNVRSNSATRIRPRRRRRPDIRCRSTVRGSSNIPARTSPSTCPSRACRGPTTTSSMTCRFV